MVHSDDLLYLLQLSSVGLIDETIFLAFIFDVLQTDHAIAFALVETSLENTEVRELFEHSLDVIVNKVKQTVQPAVVLCLPHSLDRFHAVPVGVGDRDRMLHQ